MKMFLWVATHDKVLGNAECKRRGLTIEGGCDDYLNADETTEHILRDCHHARDVWKAVAGSSRWRRWNSMNIQSWLVKNVMGQDEGLEQSEWPRMFSITMW